MRMNIQGKVGSFLGAILILSFFLSGWVSTQRTISVVDDISDQFVITLEQTAYDRALNVFTSLETGAQGSLERGEMKVFSQILLDLGKIKGVQEIGLTNAEGEIVYNSKEARRSVPLANDIFEGALSSKKSVFQKKKQDSLVIARAHYMHNDCIRCHTNANLGDISGVLFVEYDNSDLSRALAAVTSTAESAATTSVVTGLFSGLIGLLLACVGVHFLIGNLITSPLVRVRDIMQKMGAGDFRERLTMKQQDELGDTAKAINSMSEQLNTLIMDSRETVQSLNIVVADVKCSTEEVNRAIFDEQRALISTTESMEKIGISTNKINEDVNNLEESASECSSSALQMAASIEEVAISSDSLATKVSEVSAAISQIAKSIQQIADNADTLKETSLGTSSAVEQIDASNKEIEKNAKDAAEISQRVQLSAEEGKTTLGQTMEGIEKIEDSSLAAEKAMAELHLKAESIGSIVTVIEEITEQTNLLALNAAIIAAQSGEKGKSFAVVAVEIRELANKTRLSTGDIASAIESMQEVTGKAVKLNKTSHSEILSWKQQSKGFSDIFAHIFDQVQKVSNQVRHIAKSTVEQGKGTHLIRKSMAEVSEMVEKSAYETAEQSRGIQVIAKATDGMSGITTQLKNSTREQSETSKFIARSMEEVCHKTAGIRSQCLGQRSESSDIVANLGKMTSTGEHTLHSVVLLETSVQAMEKQAESLDETMSVFKVNE